RALIKPGKVGKVTYRLTVTAKNGKTSTDDITVTVKEAQQVSDVHISAGGGQDTLYGDQVISLAAMTKDGQPIKDATFKWSALNHADKIQFSSTDGFSTIIKGKHPYNTTADVTVEVKVTDTKTGNVSTATKVFKLRPKQN
ncbi:hypothetical protein, partial [Enterobacter bugandensis]